jgi:hypothetical protein
VAIPKIKVARYIDELCTVDAESSLTMIRCLWGSVLYKLTGFKKHGVSINADGMRVRGCTTSIVQFFMLSVSCQEEWAYFINCQEARRNR